MKYEQHDIGKIMGVLFIGFACYRLAEGFLVALIDGVRGVDLGAVLLIVLGMALYQHRNWARALTKAVSILGLALLFLGAVLAAHSPAESTMLGHTVECLGFTKTFIIYGFFAAVFYVPIYFLSTDKAKSEFGVLKRAEPDEADPGT